MKKTYVISNYCNGFAMYENDDFRLKKNQIILQGTFKRDKNVKGLFNGHEKGTFNCDNGEKYLIFSDHSAKNFNEL